MKKLLLPLLLLLLVTPAFAQSFKISYVDSNNETTYDQLADGLGKSVQLTFYDKSVTLSMPSSEGAFNIPKVSENYYSRVHTNSTGTITFRLTLIKTFGVISSIEVHKTYKDNKNSSKDGWLKVTAKRF